MPEYDGSIVIDTHIDTDNFEKDANKLFGKTEKLSDSLSKATEKAFNNINTSKLSSAASAASYEMQRLQMRLSGVIDAEDLLKEKIKALRDAGHDEAAAYFHNEQRNLYNEVKRLSIRKMLYQQTELMSKNEINSIINEQKEVDRLGNKITNIINNTKKFGEISFVDKEELKTLPSNLAKIEEKIINVKNNIIALGNELKKNQSAYSINELKKLTSYYETLQNTLNKLNIQKNIAAIEPTNIEKVAKEVPKIEKSITKSSESIRNFGMGFKRAFSSIGNIFSGIGDKIRSVFGGIGSIFARITQRARWIILGQIIRKLISDVKQSFEDLKTFGGPFAESAQKITDAYKRAGNSIAAAFAPVLIALTPIIVRVSNAIVDLMNKITLFTTALFTNATTATIADTSFNGYSKSVQKAARNTKKGTKAAKEQYKTLAKFDKLDVFKRDKIPESSTSNMADDIPQAMRMFKKVAIPRGIMDFKNKIMNALNEIGRKFRIVADQFNKGFTIGFKENNLDELRQKIIRIGKLLKDIFTDDEVVNKFNQTVLNLSFNLGKVVGAMSSVGVSLAKMLVGGFEKFLDGSKEQIKKSIIRNLDTTIEFNNLLGSVAEFVANIATLFGQDKAQSIFGNFLSVAYDLFDGTFSNIYKLAVEISKMISAPFIDNTDEIKKALDGLLSYFEGATEGIKKALRGLSSTLSNIVDKSISPYLKNVAEVWTSVFGAILKSWNSNVKPVFEEMGKKMAKTGEKIGSTFKKIAKPINALFEVLQTVYQKIKPFLEKYFYPLFENVFKKIALQFKVAFSVIDSVVNSALDILGNFAEFLEKIIRTIGHIITGDWGKIWDDAVGIFKAFARTILSILKTIPDLFVNVLNTIIDYLNSASGSVGLPKIQKIPSVPTYFGIPGLATGTVVSPNRRFLAMLGDNTSEPEVVSPVSTMKRAFSEAMRDSNLNGGTGDITLQIDGKTFARLINPYMSSEQNRVGISMVQGVY